MAKEVHTAAELLFEQAYELGGTITYVRIDGKTQKGIAHIEVGDETRFLTLSNGTWK